MEEYIDILTEEGKPTNEQALKSAAHRLGLWHASAQIWIVNSAKQVLLQKRASCKDSYPNLWDISVAGHLSAGDTAKQAAIREIQEEIGLQIDEQELRFLKKVKRSKIPKKGFLDNEYNYLFVVKKDFEITNLVLQKEEVKVVKWIAINELETQLIQTPELFVSHGNQYYTYIINELRLI